MSEYHIDWQKGRFAFLKDRLPPLEGKTVLELGAHNGFFGEQLRLLGAEVTCVEGRRENCVKIERAYPQLKVIHADLDTPEWPYGRFDVIINFGLFYHLLHYHERHLLNCMRNCDLMFFESVVLDDYEINLKKVVEKPEVVDQGLSNNAQIPTLAYLQAFFHAYASSYELVEERALNGNGQSYDWSPINGSHKHDAKYFGHQRKFWIVEP